MTAGITTVRRLTSADIAHNEQWVADINLLLSMQKHDARAITKESLGKSLGEMVIAVAINDHHRIIGMGVLRPTGGLNFECAEIRHLVVCDDADLMSLGTRIVQELLQFRLHLCEFIDAGGWLQKKGFTDVLVGLGFKEKPESRFRRRL